MKIERDQSPIQADRPRQDPPEPAEVRHPRRDDRPQGARSGQHSHSAARRPAFPLRQERLGRSRPGRRRSRHADRARLGRARGRQRAGRQRSRRPHPGSRSLARRTGRRSWATSWSCRASSPRAKPTSTQEKTRYTSVRRSGPESLRHFKRTYMQALRRQISSNTYNADDPRVVPIREDKRYRSWTNDPAARRQRRRHLHDGRLRLDDRRAEGDRPHRGLLDRYLAEEPIRRAGNAATSSTTRRPRKSTRRRFITRGKAAARGSARPTRCAPT